MTYQTTHTRRNYTHSPMRCYKCNEKIELGQQYHCERMGYERHVACGEGQGVAAKSKQNASTESI